MAPTTKALRPPSIRAVESATEMAPRLQPKCSASTGRKTPNAAMGLEALNTTAKSAPAISQRWLTSGEARTEP